jgi:hypothetical protein
MRIGLSTLCALAATALACCGTALAGNPSTPGTPGTPSCYGQTIAFLNHVYRTDSGIMGLGNIARSIGVSVPQAQDNARNFCAVAP